MKIFVVCDDDGNIQSLAVPNRRAAKNLRLETDSGRVHQLDVDSSLIDEEAFQGRDGEKALKRAHEAIRKLL